MKNLKIRFTGSRKSPYQNIMTTVWGKTHFFRTPKPVIWAKEFIEATKHRND
jgi:hypothetical protein